MLLTLPCLRSLQFRHSRCSAGLTDLIVDPCTWRTTHAQCRGEGVLYPDSSWYCLVARLYHWLRHGSRRAGELLLVHWLGSPDSSLFKGLSEGGWWSCSELRKSVLSVNKVLFDCTSPQLVFAHSILHLAMNCSFAAVKDLLTSDGVLVQYDNSLPPMLTCDASPCGVGAMLSHVLPSGAEAMCSQTEL